MEKETATPSVQEAPAVKAKKPLWKKPEKGDRPEKPKRPKKPKKPWTKKRIIIWAVVGLAVLYVGYSCVAAPILAVNAMRSQVSAVLGVTALQKQDITTAISATGTVESANKHYVYPTTAGYSVMEIPVKVGDAVQAGDVLCRLDDGAIQDQIDTNELNLTQQLKAANQQVKTVKDSYKAAMEAVRGGTDATLINAQSAVTNAYNSYLTAVDNYNDYLNNSSNADGTVAKAKKLWDDAKAALDAAQAATPSNVNNWVSLATAEAQAKAAYDAAVAAQSSASGQGSSLSLAVDTAYNNYVTAIRSMEAAIHTVETNLQAQKNQVASAQISAETAKLSKDLTLQQLNDSLEDTVITAPASGTVTAVYATVGGAGTGLLFVIEDVENLIVKTSVKSFDVGTVKEGMPVTIKSDATGDAVFDGAVTSIAPASQKTDTGKTDTANEAFDTEVAVTSQDTGLRIGMSVRLNYIVDEEKDVLAVPYDAVYTNAAGQDCVMGLAELGNGQYALQEMPVTLGIESDLMVAVSGEGIVEGLRVLNDPAARVPGEVVTLV